MLERVEGQIHQIRALSIEDLLARRPVNLDAKPVSRLIAGKRVLVTGAAGSIGSELCRQILDLQPAELVLLERYENGLYEIAGELGRRRARTKLHPVIADVGDANRIAEVFSAHRPQVVFHAAAHKHVPMMELNPCEAVKNNVIGTRCVARAAHRSGVERFVMISTDKAVNPTSIMGVTKRVAEFVVQERIADMARNLIRLSAAEAGSHVRRLQIRLKPDPTYLTFHLLAARQSSLLS